MLIKSGYPNLFPLRVKEAVSHVQFPDSFDKKKQAKLL